VSLVTKVDVDWEDGHLDAGDSVPDHLPAETVAWLIEMRHVSPAHEPAPQTVEVPTQVEVPVVPVAGPLPDVSREQANAEGHTASINEELATLHAEEDALLSQQGVTP
jgi:hypothetical protein